MSGNDDVKRVLTPITPDTGVPTQVDIKSLEGAIPWLEGLKQYVQDHLIMQTGAMSLTQNQGDLYFGGVDSSKLVWGKHNRYVDTVIESYRDIAHALDAAVKATESIVKNYKDAEHNNTLNVQAVEKAFTEGSQGSGSSGTSTTAVTSPSQDGSF
ncbi:hypothetical protein ACQP00_40860 [Dactylosporangium sp. CS-047395]|uniref:hypothetical protein n=1 Tax=Dactylosporangium sp. CS-047395 TaxID=3239936 RepID=UPI003D94338F